MERDALVGQSREGPLGLAWRWRTAPQGHHARCCGAIQEALARGLGLFCADQSGRESVFNNALPDVANRLAMTVEGCGHVRIGPGGPVGIHVEQEVGMFDLRGRSLPALGQWDAFLSCVVCEAHNRGLVHIDSSIPPHAGSWRDRHASITAKNKTERVLGKTDATDHAVNIKPWAGGVDWADKIYYIKYNAAHLQLEYHYDCAIQYALHEFGHALGFLHEWEKPSAPQACLDVWKNSTHEGPDPDSTHYSTTFYNPLPPYTPRYTIDADAYDWNWDCLTPQPTFKGTKRTRGIFLRKVLSPSP